MVNARRVHAFLYLASIAGGLDPGPFEHENHGPLRSSRSVHDTFRNGKSLPRRKLDRLPFQFDDETPLYNVEELVYRIVLVPVKLALHRAEPNDAVVHPTKR